LDTSNISPLLNLAKTCDISFYITGENFAIFVSIQDCILGYATHTLAKLWTSAIQQAYVGGRFFSGLHSFYEIWRIEDCQV
jgi:hypothetical protein